MLSPELEKMVLSGQARSRTFSFGGSALSSFKIQKGETIVVWQLQIFPFFDSDKTNSLLPNSKLWQKVERGLHWIELSSQQARQGVVHRSAYRRETSQQSPINPDYPVPVSGADIIPVFWLYKSTKQDDSLVCRISTFLSPAGVPPIAGAVPPPGEQDQTLPYTPATLVQPSMGGFGGFDWIMDQRRTAAGAQVVEPRSQGDTASRTALQISLTEPESLTSYTFPLVNVNYISWRNDDKGL